MRFTRFFMPFAAATALLLPATVRAQSSNGGRDLQIARARYNAAADPQVPYYEARRTAYDRGYREGFDEGEKDARRNDRFAYQDERDFQRADSGYHRSFGDRERYRQVFREGYAAGYSEGYSRNARYGSQPGYGVYRNGPYAQQSRNGAWNAPNGYRGGYYTPAFENGARDGFEKGQEDARKNRSFDPRRHSWYRSGDRHYESRYGSRQQYEDVYRRGFQQGYEDGFRSYRW